MEKERKVRGSQSSTERRKITSEPKGRKELQKKLNKNGHISFRG